MINHQAQAGGVLAAMRRYEIFNLSRYCDSSRARASSSTPRTRQS